MGVSSPLVPGSPSSGGEKEGKGRCKSPGFHCAQNAETVEGGRGKHCIVGCWRTQGSDIRGIFIRALGGQLGSHAN